MPVKYTAVATTAAPPTTAIAPPGLSHADITKALIVFATQPPANRIAAPTRLCFTPCPTIAPTAPATTAIAASLIQSPSSRQVPIF